MFEAGALIPHLLVDLQDLAKDRIEHGTMAGRIIATALGLPGGTFCQDIGGNLF